jgi:four helix bundle protein
MTNFEFAEAMKARTKAFAVEMVRFYRRLPSSDEARVLGRQALRSGTSIAANYRAACRAKSEADFISKLGTVVEETDETTLWLELFEEAGVCSPKATRQLKQQSEELLRILSASLATARRRGKLPNS